MSEPSLPQGSTELPRLFTFTLPHAEVTFVRDYAERYAPVPSFEYRVHLKFLGGTHQWFMNEANLTSWFAFDSNGPQEGILTFTMQQMNLMDAMGGDEEDVTLHINRDDNTFQFETGGVVTTLDLARPTYFNWTSEFEYSWSLRAETDHLVKLGRAMMSHPVNLPVAGLEDVPWPFIEFSFDGATLHAVRDWARFNGPCVTVDIPASGAFRGEFSCYADPFARELYFSDGLEGDVIAFSFSVDTPNIAHVTGVNWGTNVSLGHHYVYEHRFSVVQNLIDEDIEVEEDSRVGWDATVRCSHLGRKINATILCGEKNEAQFVRLSCTVIENAPWNLQLAEEMNSWNNMWANCKLVREEGNLFVVADVPITSLEVLRDSVRDLVQKANNVNDVVAVFM